MNRRRFLAAAASATAAATFSSACRSNRSGRAMTRATDRPIGANDDIRVAVVGFHLQGRSHIRAYQSMPGVRLVALCDVDDAVLQAGAADLAKNKVNAKTYRDIRALL